MVKINVRGENIEITDNLREYIDNKINKLNKVLTNTKLGDDAVQANVNLIAYRDGTFKAETTLFVDDLVFRGEKKSSDVKRSIDAVEKVLFGQLNKYKTKINQHNKNVGISDAMLKQVTSDIDDMEIEDQETLGSEDSFNIVRNKHINVKPMDDQDAALQLEMLGHEFFIFEDMNTNTNSVIYRRDDGRYGVIEIDN